MPGTSASKLSTSWVGTGPGLGACSLAPSRVPTDLGGTPPGLSRSQAPVHMVPQVCHEVDDAEGTLPGSKKVCEKSVNTFQLFLF